MEVASCNRRIISLEDVSTQAGLIGGPSLTCVKHVLNKKYHKRTRRGRQQDEFVEKAINEAFGSSESFKGCVSFLGSRFLPSPQRKEVDT